MTTDKFEESKVTKEDCDTIDCCRITESVGYLECELVDEIEVGDHVLFIGKVLNKKLNEESKRLFHKGGSEFTTTS